MKKEIAAAALWLGLAVGMAGALPVFAQSAAAPASTEPATALVISDVPLKVDHVTLLAAHVQGQRVIAVGERGAILKSDNGGLTWNSVRSQKTTRTLTSVAAFDDNTWISAGHGGAFLRSEDGGKTGVLLETEAGKDAFLGLTVIDSKTALAYGAFGLMLRSTDAGRTWQRQTVIDKDFERHINRVIVAGDGLLLVGESGTLATSHDGGVSWSKLDSPYPGSFFGATVTPGGAWLIFGMRGNIYRSTDQGAHWQKIETPTKLPFLGATSLHDKRIVLTAGLGWLAISNDDGQSFRLQRVAARSLAGAFERSDGVLLTYGETGIQPVAAQMLKN